MLIDQNGIKQGIIEIEKALKMANDVSLDLVQVSPSDANPIVCKLLDYGKYLFDKKEYFIFQSKNQKKYSKRNKI